MFRDFRQSLRKRAFLLATGALTSYGSGSGIDDGGLRKGIVKAYTVLTTGQFAGSTNITVNSKTDAHSNACVFDNNTGLMWSRIVSASVGPASDGKLPWTTNGSGEGIFAYVAAANSALLAGFSDWRIPNIFEEYLLADLEAATGLPDATTFPGWPSANTHSSTTEPDATTSALVVSWTSGTIGGVAKTTTNKVPLVRGGNP